jgi:hypothetical protein
MNTILVVLIWVVAHTGEVTGIVATGATDTIEHCEKGGTYALQADPDVLKAHTDNGEIGRVVCVKMNPSSNAPSKAKPRDEAIAPSDDDTRT